MLGLAPAHAWLERFGDILAGFHFHDVRVMSDHQVPGTGDIDFEPLTRFVKADTLKVIELHDEVSRRGLVAAAKQLREAGIG